MKDKPNCANPQCDRKGWVLIDGMFYCGECVNRLNEIRKIKNRERILEELNGNNNLSEMSK